MTVGTDMNNPGDIARVDELDNGLETVSYFREREKVTGTCRR